MTKVTITIKRVFDAHVHLRQGAPMRDFLRFSLEYCDALLPMPNLKPPLTTGAQVMAYVAEIQAVAASFGRPDLRVIPVLYMTDHTTAGVISEAAAMGVTAVKVYPKGGTTNSADGVTSFTAPRFLSALRAMQDANMMLCLHGELQGDGIDVFDREVLFLDTLSAIHRQFPRLRIVMEHVSTEKAVRRVERMGQRVAATITAHHLRFNRTDMLGAGLHTEKYCMPILKREADRRAVLAAATSGNSKFFLGSDSAPHPWNSKAALCCAAGAFTAPHLLPLLADSFEQAGALDKLEGFTSMHGPAFYGFPASERTVTLVKEPMFVEQMYGEYPALMGGETLPWSLGA